MQSRQEIKGPKTPSEGAWRLLVTPPATGAVNMALDEALLARAARTGECHARIYTWSRPTLSFGRHQTAAGCVDLKRAAALGIDFVRRPTGGRAVLHAREITYSITAPAGALGSPRASYVHINRLLVAALTALGVPVDTAKSRDGLSRPGPGPCFETAVDGEVVFEGRKLVGSAQWRDRGGLLQHGSILVEDDQTLAASLMGQSSPAEGSFGTLRNALGRIPVPRELARAFALAIATVEDADVATLPIDDELSTAASAAARRYSDDTWTWRR